MTDRLTEEQRAHHENWPDCPRCVSAANDDMEGAALNAKLTDALLQSRQDAEVAKARLDLARQALILDGYFEEREIGLDIAPRIAELSTALRAKLAESERAREAEYNVWCEATRHFRILIQLLQADGWGHSKAVEDVETFLAALLSPPKKEQG